jgi:hypothetical protein
MTSELFPSDCTASGRKLTESHVAELTEELFMGKEQREKAIEMKIFSRSEQI